LKLASINGVHSICLVFIPAHTRDIVDSFPRMYVPALDDSRPSIHPIVVLSTKIILLKDLEIFLLRPYLRGVFFLIYSLSSNTAVCAMIPLICFWIMSGTPNPGNCTASSYSMRVPRGCLVKV